jgi:hypothetical protein
MAEEVSTSKVELTEEQKAQARSALVAAGVVAPKLKKVRIPERFEDISLRWVKQAPFFSEFMLRFHFYQTNDIPTAGVNVIRSNLNFYFNPEFINGGGFRPKIGTDGHPVLITDDEGNPVLDGRGQVQAEMVPREALTDQELEGLLIHEIMHIIRIHHERSLEDHQLFNVAADMLINNDIKNMRINGRELALPEGGVYLDMATNPTQRPGLPEIKPYKGEPITEPLYLWLMDVREQFQDAMQDLIKNQQGQPGGDGEGGGQGDGQQEGSGSDGAQQGKGDLFDVLFGSGIDVHEIMGEADDLSQSTIKEIMDSAKMRGWGNVSGDAVQRIEELMKPAKISWRQVLRKTLSPLVHDYGPHFENTWSRRNRRQLPLPGLRRLSNKLIIAIDTSGSINSNELEQFFVEIEKIVRDFSQLIVLQWDTRIVDVELKYKKGDWKYITVKGRGGTHVQCVFDWMKENGYEKYPLVNFTDGWFDYGFETYGIKPIWCVTQPDSKVPHGKNIHIDINE